MGLIVNEVEFLEGHEEDEEEVFNATNNNSESSYYSEEDETAEQTVENQSINIMDKIGQTL